MQSLFILSPYYYICGLPGVQEVGVVGALFAGLGTVIILLVGYLAFNEKISTLKLIGVVLILAGVASLSRKPKPKGTGVIQ